MFFRSLAHTIRLHRQKNRVKQTVNISRHHHHQRQQLVIQWGLVAHRCQTIHLGPPHHLLITLVYPKIHRDRIITITVIVPQQPQLLMLSIHCHSLVV